jgi:hypothetical protein
MHVAYTIKLGGEGQGRTREVKMVDSGASESGTTKLSKARILSNI